VVASPPLFRQPRYRGTSSPPHVRCLRAGTIVLALASAGCSLAYQLDTTLAKKEAADQSDPLGAALPRTAAELPAEGDLAIARAAVNEVLSKGASSMPWENPKTGARGTVTPLTSVYNQRNCLPRFSGELCQERRRIVVAGSRLPRQAREVGSAQSAALE
jgi:17 kDa outer membrane surface antigen